jgi:hypothetical protein
MTIMNEAKNRKVDRPERRGEGSGGWMQTAKQVFETFSSSIF